ncbi:hypothetical protein PICMEDRAFT_35754 [Pichia membranifaciens NRRL Y-2026]|uniref:STAS domain-containing protein n=1 Tax=Pichia membranifaciens NRRL Y-2026 TaxID=763406 RepID=A0A1E3NFR7_9ASCO|nr:hypothetical protein PICMEDRAFT_35754 [Pichia membranifaciens NRRL Y-2026]ODQ44969.1 hypothetical protein PICMEDRAFT_35754 [Pichia membranifaciens NRRL Y-2026]
MVKNLFKKYYYKKSRQGHSHADPAGDGEQSVLSNESESSSVRSSSKIPKIEAYGTEPVSDYTIFPYNERVIESKDYLKYLARSPMKRSAHYVKNLFPIFSWIGYYPTQPKWIASDFITGVSVAIVLVPQAMSYAKLAGLDPVYGLYSSFIGLMMYALFATSKDVSIGPVAVMSLEVSKIINRVQDKYGDLYTAPEIATTLALLCGAITLGVGLLRLGFLVELIPLPAVMAFTTSSAFNIIASQLPGLMGYSSKVNNHVASYKIIINFLKHLPDTTVDAAFGLVGLFILYLWKYFCQHMIKRYPKKALLWTYVLNLRTAIVIIFSTLISFLIIRHHREHSPFLVTGEVKAGLQNLGMFTPPANLASRIAPDLPVATIVLVLEHISIAKSFGRLHDYKIDPNQEFIAIGVTNLVGTFFSAYPATGSFSRTALSSKCGVKTPLASIFAGFCVLLAIYCFTDAFFYIPKATLCAIIIHAVSDLMASYTATWKLYLIQPLDCGIFLVGVFIGVFASIEYGIYWAMCASCALIIWRMCWTNGTFMGRIKVAFINSGLISMADSYMSVGSYKATDCNELTDSMDRDIVSYTYKWVPLSIENTNPDKVHTRFINERIDIELPPPGVIVYRMNESFVYPNASAQTDNIIDYIKKNTRSSGQKREILWNNIGEHQKLDWNWNWNTQSETYYDKDVSRIILKPKLKILHLDFSQVVAIDATSIQALIDMKRAISLHTDSEFEMHFSGIINPWVIHGLVNAGFGGKAGDPTPNKKTADHDVEDHAVEVDMPRTSVETDRYISAAFGSNGVLYPVFGTNLPMFHLDIPSYAEYD